MRSVIYSAAARRDLKKLSHDVARRIISSIEEIKADPYSHVKKLKGLGKYHLYSLRVGDRRVIMSIEDDRLIIFVIEVGDRSKIYRKY